MSWGTRKRNTIIFFVILILIIPIVVTLFFLFYKPPNCFDGRKNGHEKGIDCGGECNLLCTTETLTPTIIWERFFYVNPGFYNVIVYVENQNPSAGILKADYVFKLYNEEGIEIAKKEGSTRIYPKSVIPIIEDNLFTDKQKPVRVSFQISEKAVFQKEEPKEIKLIVEDEKYFEDTLSNNTPRVSAKIRNISFESVQKIKVVVLLFDIFDNVIGASSTYIEKIDGESVRDINFTWPTKFKEEVSRIEVIPMYE